MANRIFQKAWTLHRDYVTLQGSFAPAGTGAITAVKGVGFTAARTGVGTFLVTFSDVYADMISGQETVQTAAATQAYPQLGTFDATASTLVLRVVDAAGAAVDVAANANNRVNFVVTLTNTTTDS